MAEAEVSGAPTEAAEVGLEAGAAGSTEEEVGVTTKTPTEEKVEDGADYLILITLPARGSGPVTTARPEVRARSTRRCPSADGRGAPRPALKVQPVTWRIPTRRNARLPELAVPASSRHAKARHRRNTPPHKQALRVQEDQGAGSSPPGECRPVEGEGDCTEAGRAADSPLLLPQIAVGGKVPNLQSLPPLLLGSSINTLLLLLICSKQQCSLQKKTRLIKRRWRKASKRYQQRSSRLQTRIPIPIRRQSL